MFVSETRVSDKVDNDIILSLERHLDDTYAYLIFYL